MPTWAITGANRGLGLEFVRQLSQTQSNTILALHRSASTDLSDVKAATSSAPAKIHYLVCDTGSESSIASLPSAAKSVLGGSKIDFLLNNAGINSVSHETSLSMTAEGLQEQLRVNVLGPAKTTQHLLEAGLLADDARVINMTSGLGSMAVSLSISPRKCATYSISKAGLNALTVQQSGEVREKLPGAVVVCCDPGWVKTRMGGEGAQLEPSESIGGMLKKMLSLTEKDNGTFFTYTGEQVPW